MTDGAIVGVVGVLGSMVIVLGGAVSEAEQIAKGILVVQGRRGGVRKSNGDCGGEGCSGNSCGAINRIGGRGSRSCSSGCCISREHSRDHSSTVNNSRVDNRRGRGSRVNSSWQQQRLAAAAVKKAAVKTAEKKVVGGWKEAHIVANARTMSQQRTMLSEVVFSKL